LKERGVKSTGVWAEEEDWKRGERGLVVGKRSQEGGKERKKGKKKKTQGQT